MTAFDPIADLSARLTAVERSAMTYRQGVVASLSPLAVTLGGSAVAVNVASVATGQTLAVGDVVACTSFGNDLLVIGVVGGAPTVPSGSLVATARSTAPGGWLLCDGAAVSRTTYANLFAAISTTFGAGNGSTTFNLPDLRGRVPVGVDGAAGRVAANDALGNASGAESVKLTAAESGTNSNGSTTSSGSHSHTYWRGSSLGGGPGSMMTGTLDFNDVTITGGTHSHPLSARDADNFHNNMQPYQVVNWIVKT